VRTVFFLPLLALTLFCSPYPARARLEYVVNGQFDSGIDGWVLETLWPSLYCSVAAFC